MSEAVRLVRNGDQVVAEVENEPDALRATIRECLRELDEEREAVAFAARVIPTRYKSKVRGPALRRLLPDGGEGG